ncbi:MAG: hypothetical protein LBN30_10605 [Oscillospiraceae bacterium]|jgi:hypothetical protein|nr:hypothetical protein [Oscillospiraceae bacterium]
MPRKKYTFIEGRESNDVNCFAFRRTEGGKPECVALSDVFCLKQREPCPFRATPEQARKAREKAAVRLASRKPSKP